MEGGSVASTHQFSLYRPFFADEFFELVPLAPVVRAAPAKTSDAIDCCSSNDAAVRTQTGIGSDQGATAERTSSSAGCCVPPRRPSCGGQPQRQKGGKAGKGKLDMDELLQALHFPKQGGAEGPLAEALPDGQPECPAVPLEGGIDCNNLAASLANAVLLKGSAKKAKKLEKKRTGGVIDKVASHLAEHGWVVCENFVAKGAISCVILSVDVHCSCMHVLSLVCQCIPGQAHDPQAPDASGRRNNKVFLRIMCCRQNEEKRT